MTPSQEAILDFIRNYPHKYPPNVHEIRAAVGLNSSSSVLHHLNELIKLGLVERRAGCIMCIAL